MLKALHFELIRSLSRPRFDLDDEKACQAQIYEWLVEQFPEYRVERERKLGLADRVDFFIAGVAIDILVPPKALGRIIMRMRRYVDNPEVTAVIVISNRPLQLPGRIHGRPLIGLDLARRRA